HNPPLSRPHLPELFAIVENFLLLLRRQSLEGLVSSAQCLLLIRCELLPLLDLIGSRSLSPRSDAAEDQSQGHQGSSRQAPCSFASWRSFFQPARITLILEYGQPG